MNDAPRVLFINPWDKRIGPNRYLADLLTADARLAQNAIVVMPEEGAAADEYRALGCAVEIWEYARLVHLARTRANARRVWQTHSRGIQFARARLRVIRPQLVVTNSENVWFGGIAARSLGIPHLQVFHALTLEYHWGGQPYLVRNYLRTLGVWNTCFVAVSQTVADMLKRNGVDARCIAIVPNGLNLDAVRAASAYPLPIQVERLIRDRAPILVTLGRISALKGHDCLVEAVAQVKTQFPNLLCLVGGAMLTSEGVEDAQEFFTRLQQRIMELDLNENLLFLGEIDHAPALLKRADVYVQPSRSESFCRAAVEALACGAPVAGFAVGALPDVVGEGGLLVPAEDVNALAVTICHLVRERGLARQLVVRGQAHISAHARVENQRAQWNRLLGSLSVGTSAA